MRIVTKRLILRPIVFKDAADIVENLNNINVSRYLSIVPYPYNLKDAEVFIKVAKKSRGIFAIVLKSSGKLIGTIGLMNVDSYIKKAAIGYWLGQEYWGQGIISEALRPFIKFSFKKLKLLRLQAGAAVENKASVKVLKKAGFKKEGLTRKSLRTRSTGKWHDTYVFSLLRTDVKI
jgi:ribosomal-protein-alanine N-acetyltransferase